MQLKREAKLLTVTGLNTKHADCRIIFVISNTFVTNNNFSELIRKISPSVGDKIWRKSFEVYDTDSPVGEVWQLNFYYGH